MSTLPLLPLNSEAPHPAAGLHVGGRWRRHLPRQVSSRRLYVVGDQVIYSFGNMMVAALLSRHCAAVQFGVYILTQRSMDVLMQLSNGFLWGPLTFRLPGTPTEAQAGYRGSVVAWQLAFCLAFTALLACAAAATGSQSDLHGTFAPLVATSGILLFREFLRRLFFAHLRFAEAFWTELATVSAQVLGVFALHLAGHLTVASALWACAAGAMPVNLWWLARDWRSWRMLPDRVIKDFRDDLRLGRWLFASNLTFLISAQCNPWLLNGLLGGASVGTYAVCESLVNIPRVALTSTQNIVGPTVARAHAEGGREQVARVVRRLDRSLLFASAIFTLAIWLSAPWVARLIYGTVPAGLRQVTVVLAINLVVYAGTLAQSFGLTALGRANITLYANALGMLAQAAASTWLIRFFGVPGAALALLSGTVAAFALRQTAYSREVRSSGSARHPQLNEVSAL